LKCPRRKRGEPFDHVAPHAGAWIEIKSSVAIRAAIRVAPHAGAWIEIYFPGDSAGTAASPPTRGRGLKLRAVKADTHVHPRRPPRGGVD